jgi:Ras-related protein Rab-1A
MTADSLTYDKIYKVLLLGDSSVGKTCFMSRYVDDVFEYHHISTIGLDYRLKTMKIGNDNIKIQIWDTAGQDRFKSITKTYFKGANGVLLLYDITNPNSFRNIKNWLEQIKENTNNGLIIVLIGNKSDLEAERQVSYDEGKELAEEYKIKFFAESSVKMNVNVKESFEMLFNELHLNKSGDINPNNISKINLNVKAQKKAKCCK